MDEMVNERRFITERTGEPSLLDNDISRESVK